MPAYWEEAWDEPPGEDMPEKEERVVFSKLFPRNDAYPCPKCRAGNQVRRGDYVRSHGYAPEGAPLPAITGSARLNSRTGSIWCDLHHECFTSDFWRFIGTLKFQPDSPDKAA